MSVEKMIVRLTELRSEGQGVRAEHVVHIDSEGALCAIGTGRNADIQLPRAQFVHLGQRHFAVACMGGKITLEVYDRMTPLFLDGADAHGAVLALGRYALEVGPHRFHLELVRA
jgi:hypothetical protein